MASTAIAGMRRWTGADLSIGSAGLPIDALFPDPASGTEEDAVHPQSPTASSVNSVVSR
jgi:hypothetical protein